MIDQIRLFAEANPQLVASSACGFFTVLGAAIYAVRIWNRRIQPHALGWAIFSVPPLVLFLGQQAEGATWSLALSGTQVICSWLFVGLILTRIGPGSSKLGQLEIFACLVLLLGIYLWFGYDNAMLGVLCALAIDVVAALVLIFHILKDGKKDSTLFWLCNLAAAAAACLSVGAFHPKLLVAPVISMALATAFLIAIFIGFVLRRRRAKAAAFEVAVERAVQERLSTQFVHRQPLSIVPLNSVSPLQTSRADQIVQRVPRELCALVLLGSGLTLPALA
jgi:hypothetical protein